MGKKDAFIDKNKAITFKLTHRDNDDPFYQKQAQSGQNVETDRVFELTQMPNMEILTEEEQKKFSSLLSSFTDQDQGKFKQKKQEQNSKFWIPPEIREKLGTNQLWIDQLKNKQQQNQDDQYEYEVEELEEIEESYNTEDEEFDENQIFDEEDEREQEEDEEEIQKKEEQAFPDLQCKDFPEFTFQSEYQKKVTEQNIIPKYEKLVLSKSVKLKKLNEYGLPLNDGYDYSKHFVQSSKKNKKQIYKLFKQIAKTQAFQKLFYMLIINLLQNQKKILIMIMMK
ncbi:hypothetical protein IMG5_186520 [Ichthyophthirius multifiliis]|uniref:Uncharacterized protein n=1 Tax=Ichthyophthirius multifiliis TaxID=5932 RepID=G0R3M6_ICHMU|nr:hypothetical protein IMG5_186520 [Ichthyophthirius multifiliis]EGR27928.1 hypothetical protein IMG5_186520 [Ichthyophthirius multifiliis]|eukprot:XP_004027273.1 hypothetical protein IMG5_186520 [Ichthyophthirius multifiliis]